VARVSSALLGRDCAPPAHERSVIEVSVEHLAVVERVGAIGAARERGPGERVHGRVVTTAPEADGLELVMSAVLGAEVVGPR
jgi:hypothetical protein